MADKETQGPEDTSWWAANERADAPVPSAPFDEPLLWPEALAWGDAEVAMPGALPPPPAPPMGADADALFAEVAADAGPGPGPDVDAQWRAADAGPGPSPDPDPDPDATIAHIGPLAGLGGGGGPAPAVDAPAATAVGSAVDEVPLEPLPQSIWSYEARPPEELLGMGALPPPTIYAEAEHGGRPKSRRLDIRPGNAAVVALISVVSLVLLGMFLSVRARNGDVPTDSSQPRPPADQIAVNGTLNTLPATTTVTTIAPGIDIAGLVPATGAPAASDVPAAAASAATTVPTTRSTAPTGTAATTTPATQPTATTAAPSPTTEATTATSTPDDTAPPTTKRTIPLPTFPTYTVPTIVIPTLPPRTVPGR